MELIEPTDNHVSELSTWFSDEVSVREWGGPLFRFPFSMETFREDAELDAKNSYVMVSVSGEMIGFGQTYRKLDRGHLSRLAISPLHRGSGNGSALVKAMMRQADQLFGCAEHSLYVDRANITATRCYEKAGFRNTVTPDDDDLHTEVQFMIR